MLVLGQLNTGRSFPQPEHRAALALQAPTFAEMVVMAGHYMRKEWSMLPSRRSMRSSEAAELEDFYAVPQRSPK